jgi:uncharacterized LabA/DUF88 family protein
VISWQNSLKDHAITPIFQFSYTQGKNASDSALIIDAMDILYSGKVNGFCLVTSDSDFTKLAIRLRESGMLVIGMGEKKTPTPFISACEKFKYLEVLASMASKPAENTNNKESQKQEEPKVGMTSMDKLIEAIKTIITEISDEDGWAFLGEVGSTLNKRYPDFDTRNYGYSKLTPFVSSLKHFEIRSIKTSNPSISLKYIRNKD